MALINSYADAVAAGNALLWLPPEIRQEIFAHAALSHMRQNKASRCINASDILQGRQCSWLPPMCLVNDQFFLESLPMVLRHVDLIVEESYTAYNLLFFLQATKMFSYISSLRFITSEALPPLSAGTALIKECVNLREVWLSFMGQELFKKDALSVKKFGKKEFVENYAIRELLSLRQIKKVTLFVIRDFQCSVLDDVTVAWEMGPWLKKKFHRRGVDVEVKCMLGDKEELEIWNRV